jgi:hypothetical protein
MSVVANIVVASSNANVYIDSVIGIAVADCVITNSVPRSDNIRVEKVFASSNVIQVSSNLSTGIGDTVTFQKLVSNVGLYATNTFETVFLKVLPSYSTNVDPRLPKYDFLTSNLTAWSNAEIAVSNIALFPAPSSITANSTVSANTYFANGIQINSNLWMPLSSTVNVNVGDKIVTANIPSTANSIVQRIFSNASVLIQNLTANTNIIVSANETCYFYPKNFTIRNLRTVSSNTLLANTLVLTLETVDNIKIGSLIATANIVALVSDDTLTTVRKIFSANNTVIVQNIDANVTVSAGEYLYFSNRPTVGAVRIASEVIWYEKIWTANSRLTDLTRNVGGTTHSTISGNVFAGNLVSILGLR